MNRPPTPAENFSKAAQTEDFDLEIAQVSFTEDMLCLMEERGITRSKLAEKLNIQPSRVTAMLSGAQNLTFASAVRVARALDAKFLTKLCPSEKRWVQFEVANLENVSVFSGARIGHPSTRDDKYEEAVPTQEITSTISIFETCDSLEGVA